MELVLTIISISIPLLILAWRLPEKWQLLSIALATAVFLGFVSPISLILLSVTTTFSYYILKHFSASTWSVLSIVILMAAIFLFFKLKYGIYFNFSENRILPLGLSYYSFRQIHYAVEAYKGKLPRHTFIDYLSYLFFLPTIFVGPINRFQPFMKDLQRRRWDSSLFSSGLERILYGLVKVCFIGNFLMSTKLNNFALSITESYTWLSTYLQMFKFAANAYFQFAGYSDIAIGLSLLFGFNIIENFRYPFLAKNISDFWKRWHISLSEWCRDYVFYPFLSITRNARIAIILSMLVLGIWHEISIRYVLWGVIHAVAINIWYRYDGSLMQQKLSEFPIFQKGLGIFITLNFVMLSFVIIKEDTLTEALETYKILFFLKN